MLIIKNVFSLALLQTSYKIFFYTGKPWLIASSSNLSTNKNSLKFFFFNLIPLCVKKKRNYYMCYKHGHAQFIIFYIMTEVSEVRVEA